MDAIFNRPPQIAEDTICYRLYLPSDQASKSEAESLSTIAQTYIEELLPGHLWNRDSFELKPVQDVDPKRWLLQGIMRVGDCVDDEWLVVWLLKQITMKLPIIASVYDTDGEFLLIEAAEHLPSWITPTNAMNRVWLYQSELHIIPLDYASPTKHKSQRPRLPGRHNLNEEGTLEEDGTEGIDLYYGLSLVRDKTVQTKSPKEIQDAVWRRTRGYPQDARQHIQYTSAYLPLDIARALSQTPHLIQKAAEAFYTRDAIQLRYVHKMERFPPNTSVLHTIEMTRTAYAQLLGQKFHRPKVFGHWKEEEGSREWRWRDIGMKVAAGFEMLFQESKKQTSHLHNDNKKTSLDSIRDGLMRGSEYRRYFDILQKSGYFKNELPGSSLWHELEEKAVEKFVEMHREDNVKRPSFSSIVQMALVQCPVETFHPSVREEDSDDWLNIDRESFENIFSADFSDVKEKEPVKIPASEEAEAEKQTSRLKDLADKVHTFVDGQGSLEGALFENEADSDEEAELEELSEGLPSDGESSDNNESHRTTIENLVPALDPSEYGIMPSYYSNSQPLASTSSAGQEIKPDREEPSLKSREPLLPRDKFDGVDSDDETESDEERLNQFGARDGENSDSEEDRPQVVGEEEIDMGEEEEEFIKFSRDALGIDEEMWANIVKDREARGAFVPTISKPLLSFGKGPATTAQAEPSQSLGGTRAKNPNLDSFEAVMRAMESELAEHKKSKSRANRQTKANQSKGEVEEAEADPGIEMLLDEEVKGSLKQDSEDEDGLGNADVDYNLIKNFLESFKGQAGLAGPVGNLAGRLQPDWKLPRDNS